MIELNPSGLTSGSSNSMISETISGGSAAPSRARSSYDLSNETFSVGSVDVCQVIRSAKPPMVPLRMEMRCDGFETVRTKRRTINRCIQKLDKAKKLLELKMKQTEDQENIDLSAVSYGAYVRTHNNVKSGRLRQRQTALGESRSFDSNTNKSSSGMLLAQSLSGASSRARSSYDLSNETFSVGSVDVCQVIRSDRPPMVPLRMELNCDGFETVRTKRNTIHRCIKKLDEARFKLIEERKRQCAVSYGSYVKTHDDVRERRKAKLLVEKLDRENKLPKRFSSKLGLITEDISMQTPTSEGMRTEKTSEMSYLSHAELTTSTPTSEQNTLKSDERTGKTCISSTEWTSNEASSHIDSSLVSYDPSSSIVSLEEEMSFKQQDKKHTEDKEHELLFDESGESGNSNSTDVTVPHVNLERANPIDVREREAKLDADVGTIVNTKNDKYATSRTITPKEADKYHPTPDDADTLDAQPIHLGTKNDAGSFESNVVPTVEEQRKLDNFSFSVASSVDTINSSDKLISFSISTTGNQYHTERTAEDNSLNKTHSAMDSTIVTTSEHNAMQNEIFITFTSESELQKQGLSEDSPQPLNSMYSPQTYDIDFAPSSSDDEMSKDRYKSTESQASSCKYKLKSISSKDDMNMMKHYYVNEQDEEIDYNRVEHFYVNDKDQRQDVQEERNVNNFNNHDWGIDEESDDEEDVGSEFIPIGEYHFESGAYYSNDYSQYHYVDEKYLFSNSNLKRGINNSFSTNQMDGYDEGNNQLFDTACIQRCVPATLWNSVKKDNKKRKKKKKKKKKKEREAVDINEIVFVEDECYDLES